MKKILHNSLAVMLIALGTSACDDFLSELPQTARSTDNFYKTEADFKNATVGLYATLKHTGLYGNGGSNASMLFLTEVVSDNATLGSTKNPASLSQFEIDEFNFSLSNSIISNAWTGNYIGIGRANAILENLTAATFGDAAKARFEGEARFMRAFFYFNLVRLFGDVQLIDKVIKDPYGANDIGRTPAEQIYAFVINDLTVAEANLPQSIPDGEAGRASRWAAKALLGKVYLTINEDELAAAKLKEVIDANIFNITANTYAQVFTPATSYAANKDVIWAVYYKSGLVGQGSALWSALIPWGAPGTLFGTTGSGEGFMKPTTDMLNAYEADDVRKDATVRASYTTAAGATVNEPYVYKYRQTGMQAGDADSDLPLLRYADVLLMYAEALNNQDMTVDAANYINQVRARANLAPLDITDPAEMALAIERERRVEFAFEGHRWFDLVRTDRYQVVLEEKGYPVKAFNRLYPVPQRETELTSLSQNDGY